MQTLEQSSKVKDITRGGQLYMHSLRMFGQVLKITLMISLVLFATLFMWLASKKTTEYDRYILGQYLEAKAKAMFNEHAYNRVENPKGTHPRTVQINSDKFLKMPFTLHYVARCSTGFLSAFKWALGASSIVFILILGFLNAHGKKERATIEAKGHHWVSPKELKKRLKEDNEASDLTLAGAPLLKDSEVQHILFTGSTGTGKSVGMQELMDQVRKRGERAIVYDIEGSFISTYYRPDKDIILNPLDKRSPPWNHWQECRDAADFESVASSLMPLHLANTDPFWINSARTIFSSASLRLQMDKKTKNQFLLQPMFTESLGGLSHLVRGSVAESLVSERTDKTALNIKSTLANYVKVLTYLKDDEKAPLFSIRTWIENDKDDGWLFIASNALKVEALKPLISVWLDVAAKSVLSLTPSLDRRLWFFMDELASLHRLPSLIETLSRSRKYGGCFIAAIQDIHQLRTIYGQDESKTLTGLFNTHLCYRTQGPDSAHWMSKIMGGKEIIEKKEGYSMGAHEMRDGVSLHQERRHEPVVMELEFLELDNLQAFLRLPGDWPVTKLHFKFKNRKKPQPALVPRELSNVLFVENVIEENKNSTNPKENKAIKIINPTSKSLSTAHPPIQPELDLNA